MRYSEFKPQKLLGQKDVKLNGIYFKEVTNKNIGLASGLQRLSEKDLSLLIQVHGKRVNQRLVELQKANEQIQNSSNVLRYVSSQIEKGSNLFKVTKSGNIAFNLNQRKLSLQEKQKLASEILKTEYAKTSTIKGTKEKTTKTIEKIQDMFGNENINANTIGDIFEVLKSDKFYAWYKSLSKEDLYDIFNNENLKENLGSEDIEKIFSSKENLTRYLTNVTSDGNVSNILDVLQNQKRLTEDELNNIFLESNE